MKTDRVVGDANLPDGVDLLPGSIVYLDTDVDFTGISLGYGGGRVEGLFGVIDGADPRESVGLWIRLNDFLHKAGNEGADYAAPERHRHRTLGPEGEDRRPAAVEDARRKGRAREGLRERARLLPVGR